MGFREPALEHSASLAKRGRVPQNLAPFAYREHQLDKRIGFRHREPRALNDPITVTSALLAGRPPSEGRLDLAEQLLANRRQRVPETAIALFATKAFRATTVAEIAAGPASRFAASAASLTRRRGACVQSSSAPRGSLAKLLDQSDSQLNQPRSDAGGGGSAPAATASRASMSRPSSATGWRRSARAAATSAQRSRTAKVSSRTFYELLGKEEKYLLLGTNCRG